MLESSASCRSRWTPSASVLWEHAQGSLGVPTIAQRGPIAARAPSSILDEASGMQLVPYRYVRDTM